LSHTHSLFALIIFQAGSSLGLSVAPTTGAGHQVTFLLTGFEQPNRTK
jgi:hypothetical protein